jgi:hypothetical protein
VIVSAPPVKNLMKGGNAPDNFSKKRFLKGIFSSLAGFGTG